VLRNPETHCIKFGITSREGHDRFRKHRRDGYTEIIYKNTGLPEGLAAFFEQNIQLALAMVDAEPVRGREYFSDAYLGLIENEINNWMP